MPDSHRTSSGPAPPPVLFRIRFVRTRNTILNFADADSGAAAAVSPAVFPPRAGKFYFCRAGGSPKGSACLKCLWSRPIICIPGKKSRGDTKNFRFLSIKCRYNMENPPYKFGIANFLHFESSEIRTLCRTPGERLWRCSLMRAGEIPYSTPDFSLLKKWGWTADRISCIMGVAIQYAASRRCVCRLNGRDSD